MEFEGAQPLCFRISMSFGAACVRAVLVSLICTLPGFSPIAQGLIVFDSPTSMDNARNVIDPGDASSYPDGSAAGVPWQHVARYGSNNASAVYIGNGYVLTARHVSPLESSLIINGANYSRDTSFQPVAVTIPNSPSNVVVDLSLQKILGDPGLPELPLASSTANDTNKAVVMVGWGKGKGALITDEGWSWGADSTRALRWGTNTTTNTVSTLTYNVGGTPMNFKAISTLFNSDQGENEAAGTMGDSGSALFQKVGSTWMLSGITVTVSTLNSSRYTPADATYFVRLREYSWIFRYDHWKSYHSIPLETPDGDDSDEDGVPLLVEYALGMNPTVSSRSGFPATSIENGNLALTYSRLASTTDVAVEIETSTTLEPESWTVESAATIILDSSTVVQTVKTLIPLGSSQSKFARIKVSKLY